jgi:hypothetical protein
LDAVCLRDNFRRMLVAQIALMFGPDTLREQLSLWLQGELSEQDAAVLRAGLDALAGQLLS